MSYRDFTTEIVNEFGFSIRELCDLTQVKYGTVWRQMKNGYCAYPRRQSKGWSNNPLYSTWEGMHRRCYDVNHDNYKNYGAKGITVCARWHDFTLWLEDMGHKPDSTYTLDRINSNGNYDPSNTRWASRYTQVYNRKMIKRKTEWGIHEHGLKFIFTFRKIKYSFNSYEEAVIAKKNFYKV